MASKITIKRSAVQNKIPHIDDLDLGELALNTYDGKLFAEINTGIATVVEIGSNLSNLRVSGVSTFSKDLKLDDNASIYCGFGSDLRIFHNGSNSFIVDQGTGSLFIDASSTYYRSASHRFLNGASTETLAIFTDNGSVELYYDNSKKFETSGAGVTVTGTVVADQLSVSGVATISGLKYPTADGTAGQALVSNGSGVLSFTSIQAGSVKTLLPVMTRSAQSNTKNAATMVTISAGINTVIGRFGSNYNISQNALVPFRQTVGITTHSLIETFFNTVVS